MKSAPYLFFGPLFASTLSLIAISGCGSDDTLGEYEGGGTGGGAPFDLSKGTWKTENASNTSATISHDGALAILSDGTRWLAGPTASDRAEHEGD